MGKNTFQNLLAEEVRTYKALLETKSGDWIVKGFVDINRNVYTVTNDTKVVSKIIEIILIPRLYAFAKRNGLTMELPSAQNYYPDLTFKDNEGNLFAVDFKSSYYGEDGRVNGLTLGSYWGCFRNRDVKKIGHVSQILKKKDWKFDNVSFRHTIAQAKEGDIIYCYPPYFGRYVDYYNGWTEEDEQALFEALTNTPAKFILSTWHHNDFRANEMIEKYWKQFNVLTKDHFYHNGGKIENRHSIVEALVVNFDMQEKTNVKQMYQLDLFDEAV